MFECSSQPNGAYDIMAIDESEESYNHIVRVLLDAAIDSPIDLLLRANNCTSIARLIQLIKFRLKEELYEDLLAITPYINWTNDDGLFDMTTQTCATFDTYIICHFHHENPTEYDEQVAAASGCFFLAGPPAT